MTCARLEKETYVMSMETFDTAVAQEREIYASRVMVTYDARVKEMLAANAKGTDGALLVKEIYDAE